MKRSIAISLVLIGVYRRINQVWPYHRKGALNIRSTQQLIAVIPATVFFPFFELMVLRDNSLHHSA